MRKRDWIPVAVLAILCGAMAFMPSAPRVVRQFGEPVRARVLKTDESTLVHVGLLEYGTQRLEVRVLEGPGQGKVFPAANELRAQMDLDKRFKAGDTALVTWPEGGADGSTTLVARDHWRMGWAYALFGAFAVLLVVFGGLTGAKALFSFVFSCFAVWKLLVPLCLDGWNASWTSFAVVSLLTAVIMYLVAGATRKGAAATLGAMLGVSVSLLLAKLISWGMHVNGATMPYATALVYSGFEGLDLVDLFNGSIILASSGAVMDLAMDISAGVAEVARHNPDLSRRALFLSGIRMGRAVVGTMTTTLLLAYSGGYLTLLMVFASEGTSPGVFLNSPLVSAELVKTLVGSFGLVLVAPFTALVSAFLMRTGKGAGDAAIML